MKKEGHPIDLHMVEVMEMIHKTDSDTKSGLLICKYFYIFSILCNQIDLIAELFFQPFVTETMTKSSLVI